jgi:hypothetical protein
MQHNSGEAPEPPIEVAMADGMSPPQEPDRKAYKARYWEEYKGKRQRVFITLSPQQHREIAALAKAAGRSVAQQIWQESCAYRQQRFLPTAEIERQMAGLVLALRQIGDAIIKAGQEKGLLGGLRGGEAKLGERIRAVEETIRAFVQRPWRDAP